ncbi:MAG: hypothetical protein H7267_01395 [Sandarakinorhabdus sp.]|nr:hypothetical protein [Sandarakinorhabdus sp.]
MHAERRTAHEGMAAGQRNGWNCRLLQTMLCAAAAAPLPDPLPTREIAGQLLAFKTTTRFTGGAVGED